jgi:hypothetical protein
MRIAPECKSISHICVREVAVSSSATDPLNTADRPLSDALTSAASFRCPEADLRRHVYKAEASANKASSL